jgi:CRP-like cAMP-binding protein
MIKIMSDDLVEALSKLTEREQKIASGDVLFRKDDPVLSLFLVMAGAIRLIRVLPGGLELTLQRAGPGAILAEASVFARQYHCDAAAIETSVLRVVPLRRFNAALRTDPGLASALARHLAHEVQRTRAHAETLSLKTVAARVDAWIALHEGSLAPKGRWREIASEIGITPEALYRELARRRSGAQCGSSRRAYRAKAAP